MNEIVRHFEEVEAIEDICGEIRAFSSREDFKGANLALVTMLEPNVPHYHKITTEFYFIIDGEGALIIGREVYQIESQTLIIIPPNKAHYFIPRRPTKLLVFCIPAWSKEDEIVLEEDETVVHYSTFSEKFELINEILFRCDLGFKDDMSQEEREELDVERQSFVLRAGYNNMSVPELRELLKVKQ